MQAAAERIQRKTTVAAAEERRSWDRASKAREKRAKMRLDENVAVAGESVTQETTAVRSEQKSSVVVIEDNVASASETAAGATLADVRSVQVTSDVGSQRPIGNADARPEEEEEVAEVELGSGS